MQVGSKLHASSAGAAACLRSATAARDEAGVADGESGAMPIDNVRRTTATAAIRAVARMPRRIALAPAAMPARVPEGHGEYQQVLSKRKLGFWIDGDDCA